MSLETLEAFVDAKINHYGKAIVTGSDKGDAQAYGELTFYLSLRRVLKKSDSDKPTMQDRGMMDAVNDTLEHLGLIDKKKAFYKQ